MADIVSIVKNNGSTIATVSKQSKLPPSDITSDKYIRKTDFRRFTFDIPALKFQIAHGMNTTQFMETIRDADGNHIYARTEIVDRNSFNVYLTEAISATVDVLFGIEYTP